MWKKFNKDRSSPKKLPEKDISYDELKKAIHQYESQLPSKIPLSVIINDDLTIDYQLLAPILKAIPKSTFYMSRETYDLFKEEDYQLALDMDMVQQAVDKYVDQINQLPVIDDDPYRKVSFHKLQKLNLIEKRPERDFYITDQEYLVSLEKPS